jgi:hypothetical protein
VRLRPSFLIAIAAGGAFIALVFAHWDPVNGPSYYQWPWFRRGDILRVIVLLFLAAVPAFIAQFVAKRALAVALLIVTPPILQLTAIELWPTHPSGLDRAEAILVHPMATSYLWVANQIAGQDKWLREFDRVLQGSAMHAATKPPGPISFFKMHLAIFGMARTPRAAATTMLLFGAAAVLASYLSFRAIADHDVGFAAATLVALLPSMTALYPVMDWLYPVLSCAALALWHLALVRRSMGIAFAFAAVVVLMSFLTYSLLVIGAPLALMTIAHLVRHRDWKRVATQVAAVAITFVAAYGVLWLTTGFDPIKSFRTALERQAEIMAMMDQFWIAQGLARRWPATIAGDLQEFGFGICWIPIALALTWAVARGGGGGRSGTCASPRSPRSPPRSSLRSPASSQRRPRACGSS